MPNYLRVYIKGATVFFTVVTHKRNPVFQDDVAINLLRQCIQKTMNMYPFKMDAIVILLDHLHTIWTLPENDFDFSIRWKRIKSLFSRNYHNLLVESVSESMRRKNEKGVWQRRFWEHVVKDQEDFNRLCDYIHYNPVKHGLVNSPWEWKHSSFRKHVEFGSYSKDWGQSEIKELQEMDYE